MTNLNSKYKYKIFDFLEYLKKTDSTAHQVLMERIPAQCNVSRMTFYRWIKIPLLTPAGEKEKDIPAKSLDIIAACMVSKGINVTAESLKNYKISVPINL